MESQDNAKREVIQSDRLKDASIEELRDICQASDDIYNDRWFGIYFARTISIYITKILIRTPITANQVTFVWFLLDIAAAVSFSFGHYWYSIIGSLLVLMSYILDSIDGEIARYRHSCSMKGAYLDRIFHDISYPFIFIGISFGVYANFHSIWAFVLGFSASIFILLPELIDLEYIRILVKSDVDIKKLFNKDKAKEDTSKISTKIVSFLTLDYLILAIIVFSILNYLPVVLIVSGIILPFRLFIQILLMFKNITTNNGQ